MILLVLQSNFYLLIILGLEELGIGNTEFFYQCQHAHKLAVCLQPLLNIKDNSQGYFSLTN